jgi:hypothetical protein
VKANFRFSTNDNHTSNSQLFSDYNLQPYNSLTLNNHPELAAYKITTAAIYRHLFKKKGRSFAVSAGYNTNLSDGTSFYNSVNKFFEANTPTDQISQLIHDDKNVMEIKSSILYTEPLSKKWYFEFFYNFSQLANYSNWQAYPYPSDAHIDSLSNYYEQVTLYNRLGSVIRYSFNGINASIGLAAQQLKLNGNYSPDKGMAWDSIGVTKTYTNLTPNLNINYEFKNNIRLEVGYTNNISAPGFNDLQPITNTSNPAYQVVGNPDLIPENSQEINTGLYYWNPSSFLNIGFQVTGGITNNPIVYNQVTVFEPGTGMITISTPENMEQSKNINSWLWSNIPIIKTKLTVDVNGGVDYNNSPARINGVPDNSISKGISCGGNINITPGTKLVLTAGFWGNFNKIEYIINEKHNQDYYNYTLRSSVKWQFVTRMFFESNFNYSVYKNKEYGFDQAIPLWNASVRRIIGKKNKFEMRLAAFDIFNININVSQYATKNYIQTSKTNTLSRYFMLSVTYNMKGFENKIQKNRFW